MIPDLYRNLRICQPVADIKAEAFFRMGFSADVQSSAESVEMDNVVMGGMRRQKTWIYCADGNMSARTEEIA